MKQSDEYYMKLALDEAFSALEREEIPVGTVIVMDERIIARGHNLTQTLQDVTAHAEMQAITAAANFIGAKYLSECTLYVTLEPCVMCAGAIAWAQLGRLVYGAGDPKKGYSLLGQNILHPKTEVFSGILENECGSILRDFFQKKRK
ncbi:MAG: nucleoside deaminase [Bacteroidales bacterium]|jgi:tRNA(adenine34) deaminase|nr:nucleoside deaminase [Bacteroidales bacterium]